jgi:hypothetical protein
MPIAHETLGPGSNRNPQKALFYPNRRCLLRMDQAIYSVPRQEAPQGCDQERRDGGQEPAGYVGVEMMLTSRRKEK